MSTLVQARASSLVSARALTLLQLHMSTLAQPLFCLMLGWVSLDLMPGNLEFLAAGLLEPEHDVASDGLHVVGQLLGEPCSADLLAAGLLEPGLEVAVPEHDVAADGIYIVGSLLKGLLLVVAKHPAGLDVGDCHAVVADGVGTCESRVSSAQ